MLTKAARATKLFVGHARVSLFEEADDLLIGKSGLFHSCYAPKLAEFVPLPWYGSEGAGQSTELRECKYCKIHKMLITMGSKDD